MLKTIVRYGMVLGVLMLLFEFLRRANALRFVSDDIYLSIVAIVFLVGGIVLSWTLFRIKKTKKNRGPASINNGEGLSVRESEVLSFLVHGFSNAEIASSLGVSQNTVKTHLKNLFVKLDVSNRTEAAAEAKLRGIID